MADTEFRYKGKQMVIREDHPHATVTVDDREFACHHHHADRGLDMWMCEESYFASPDIKELARHFADYGYMFDDPNRVVVDETGEVVKSAAKKPAAKKGASKKAASKRADGGHASGGGH